MDLRVPTAGTAAPGAEAGEGRAQPLGLEAELDWIRLHAHGLRLPVQARARQHGVGALVVAIVEGKEPGPAVA